MLRLLILFAAVGALGLVEHAAADGEAGLVIDWGDGRVETQCVAFEGDSISGADLLERAGHDLNQFSGLVCAIDNTGCQHSGSFDSCTCECTGSGDCVYWAYFVQPYAGSWRYSALGVFATETKDGDLQGWKWGPGGPASAPPPAPTSFEAVCGHPPQGGEPPTMATTAPTSTPTVAAPVDTPAASPAGTSTSRETETPVASSTPGPTSTSTRMSTATVMPTVTTGQVTIPVETPGAPAAGGKSDGGGGGALFAFLAVASVIVVGGAAAYFWRVRRGG